jgi:hypothetical protein
MSMSAIAPPQPLKAVELACDTCLRAIYPQICKANDNGNAGRAFYRCDSLQANGQRCKFFRWGSPKNTPTSSPTLPMTATMPEPVAPMQSHPSAPLDASLPMADMFPMQPHPSAPSCPAVGCGATRINAFCLCKLCHKHCREHGGCSAKGHDVLGTTATANAPMMTRTIPMTSTATPNAPTMTTPMTSNMPHYASQMSPFFTDQIAPPMTLTAAPNAPTMTTPMTSNMPRYASQMSPFFTDQIAREQALHERKRALDAEHLLNVANTKHQVVVYSWYKVRAAHTLQ